MSISMTKPPNLRRVNGKANFWSWPLVMVRYFEDLGRFMKGK